MIGVRLSLKRKAVDPVEFMLAEGFGRPVLPYEHGLLFLDQRFSSNTAGVLVYGQFGSQKKGGVFFQLMPPGKNNRAIFSGSEPKLFF